MLKNYLKVTLRNIKKQKGYSFINITSLAIGLSCCILILIYIRGAPSGIIHPSIPLRHH